MRKLLLFLLALQCLAVLCEGATLPATSIQATPSTLAFGNVSAGQSKTLTVSLKNTTSIKLNASLVPPSGFSVNPTATIIAAGQSASVSVTVSSTQLGPHNGNLGINFSAFGIDPRGSTTVPLTSQVLIDLSVGGALRDCSVTSTARTCSVVLNLVVHGANIQTARTQVFESRDGAPETNGMDGLANYLPTGSNPFIYGLQNVPISVKKIVLRVVADPANAVAEGDETNNTALITINF